MLDVEFKTWVYGLRHLQVLNGDRSLGAQVEYSIDGDP